jgi:aspartate carbamoyltransferase catalytic subunit
MNILDERFAEFKKLPTEEKIECFEKNDRLFDMIISQQLNRKIIDDIYEITNYLRNISKSKAGSLFMQNILCHKRAMLYFTQPSSRTFLSFESACHMLGMKTSEIRDVSLSSEVKGESYDDSLRTFSSYTDLIIIRHKGQDSAERAAWLLNTHTSRPVPVINGGSGSDQHPTQAILDVYTLQRSFANQGGLDGKTILMCGDLKRGRTVRSLSYLMKNFEEIEIIFAAPKAFQMKEDVCSFLEGHKIPYHVETEALENVLSKADAIYMTRIQDEHDTISGDSNRVDTSRFKLRPSDMSKPQLLCILSREEMKLM